MTCSSNHKEAVFIRVPLLFELGHANLLSINEVVHSIN